MAARKKPRSRKPTTLADAPATTRKAILTGIRGVLKKHGVDDRVVQLQVKPKSGARRRPAAATRTARAARAAAPTVRAPGACPPGTVRRVVCFFRKGTFVCEERCVPA